MISKLLLELCIIAPSGRILKDNLSYWINNAAAHTLANQIVNGLFNGKFFNDWQYLFGLILFIELLEVIQMQVTNRVETAKEFFNELFIFRIDDDFFQLYFNVANQF